MENVVLIIHLLLALSLIGTVLLQRSEGGGLGIGGGGGGATGGRPTPTAMSKFTWILAGAFICTSISLTLIAASNTAGSSVVDRLGVTATQEDNANDLGDSLLPPSSADAPLVPSGE